MGLKNNYAKGEKLDKKEPMLFGGIPMLFWTVVMFSHVHMHVKTLQTVRLKQCGLLSVNDISIGY